MLGAHNESVVGMPNLLGEKLARSTFTDLFSEESGIRVLLPGSWLFQSGSIEKNGQIVGRSRSATRSTDQFALPGVTPINHDLM